MNRYTFGASDVRCEDGQCVIDPGCDVDSDCDAGEVCASGQYQIEGLFTRSCADDRSCASDADCADGQACAGSRCVVPPCEPGGCADGEVCADGVCRERECDRGDCGARAECDGGLCVPTTCATDCGEGAECVRTGRGYECLRPCDSICDCFWVGGTPDLCSDGYCVEAPCIDGVDFACGSPFNLTCVNARAYDPSFRCE